MNYINTVLLSVICFLVICIFLLDISFNISWEASITDWLSVIIYACTFGTAIWAAITAKNALNENKRMANDNRRLVDAQTEPFVDIKLEIMPESVNWVRLKIQNLGLSSAFNIKFTIKDIDLQNNISKIIINKFFEISFMRHGLNYLSKSDFRYTGFINLLERNRQRGFTLNDFLGTEFTVKITFEDINKKQYQSEFLLAMNELIGIYRIGKSFEEQLIGQMKNIDHTLMMIVDEHKIFNNQYEKTQSGWTESDLKFKLSKIKAIRKRDEYLGRTSREKLYEKPEKKQSINQIRRQMK
ncbi:hypothetical protein KW868_16225 [Acinetobacter guillouiae]|uniref:Uncharacterized protein n=1 Tax=Acinetobacter guillouiae TaxID=106649 RepID=A0A8X8GKD2_ACIGI|nr:hypothetical protein [Acinetobacter guillouiae]MCF0265995.1 hypothetical protein [Acinetobacter guillouiae]